MTSHYEQRIAAVRQWFTAFNTRDYASIADLFHPEVEYEYDPKAALEPAGRSCDGHEGIASLMRSISARYPDVEIAVNGAEDLGEALMVRVIYAATGLPDDAPRAVSALYEFEGEAIRRVRWYVDDGEARAAAANVVQDEFRTLFESAIEAILLIDAYGVIRDANESARTLLTCDGESLIGRRYVEFVPADRRADWGAAWSVLSERGKLSGDSVVRVGDELIPVEVRARAGYRLGLNLVLLGARATEGSFRRAAAPTLTPREREILRMLALGFNAPEIADRLFLSPATVRTHVQNGMVRLGARTRVQAVALALTQGEIAL